MVDSFPPELKNNIKFIGIGLAIVSVIIGLLVLLIYGTGTDFINELETQDVVTEPIGRDLPSADFEDIDFGIVVPGQGDAKQQEMAKETLSIYRKVIEDEGEILEFFTDIIGNKEDALRYLKEILIGIHVVETATYSSAIRDYWKDKPNMLDGISFIPSNYVPYPDYGTKYTFSTYNWKSYNSYREKEYKDYIKRHGENSFNQHKNTSDSKHSLFHAGYWSWNFRNTANATGPMQVVMRWFSTNHTTQTGDVYYVPDIETYATHSSEGSSSWNQHTKDKNSDIWNFENQVRVNYRHHVRRVFNSSELLEEFEVNNTNNKDDFLNYFKSLAFGTYFGENQFLGVVRGNVNGYRKIIDDIYNDKEFIEECKAEYLKSASNSAANSIIDNKKSAYLGSHGGFKIGSANMGTYTSDYIVKSYVIGLSWYEFLKSIARGMRPDVGGRVGTEGIGKVYYNYMEETNGKRRTDAKYVESNMDEFLAIGYKGPYPIFYQSYQQDYVGRYKMSGGSSLSSACTWYAATSAMYGMGLSETVDNLDLSRVPNYVDRKNPNTPDFLALWSYIITEGGSKPIDLTKNPSARGHRSGSSTNVRGAIKNAGYMYDDMNGKNRKERMIEHIKSGVPVHIRTKSGISYSGVAPVTPWNEIDYREHDMHTSEYKWDSPGKYQLAATVHSVIAVDYKEVNGKMYLSIVDSSYSHSSYDSNLIWWDADEIFRHDADVGGYSYAILGGANNTPLKPLTERGQASSTGGVSSGSKLEGEYSTNLLADILNSENTDYEYNESYNIAYINSTSNADIEINLNYSNIIEFIEGSLLGSPLSDENALYLVTGIDRNSGNRYAVELEWHGYDKYPINRQNRKITSITLPVGRTLNVRQGTIVRRDGVEVFYPQILVEEFEN